MKQAAPTKKNKKVPIGNLYQRIAFGQPLSDKALLRILIHADTHPHAIPYSMHLLNGLGTSLSSTWVHREAISDAEMKELTLLLVRALGNLASKEIMRYRLDKGLALLPLFGSHIKNDEREREFKVSLRRYYGNIAKWSLMRDDEVMFGAALSQEPSLATEVPSDEFLIMVSDKFLAGEQAFINAWQQAHGSFELCSKETMLSLEECVILADLGHLIRKPDISSASEAESRVAKPREDKASRPCFIRPMKCVREAAI